MTDKGSVERMDRNIDLTDGPRKIEFKFYSTVRKECGKKGNKMVRFDRRNFREISLNLIRIIYFNNLEERKKWKCFLRTGRELWSVVINIQDKMVLFYFSISIELGNLGCNNLFFEGLLEEGASEYITETVLFFQINIGNVP